MKKKNNASQQRKQTKLSTKLLYVLVVIAVSLTVIILWPELFPKEDLSYTPIQLTGVQPTKPEPPAESFPAKFIFKTDPERDTTVVFHLRYNDDFKDVEWRDKTNTVVIWRTTQGNPYQIVSHAVQKKWKPLPKGGELTFNNGKVLTVKFVKEKRPVGAPLDPNPEWLK